MIISLIGFMGCGKSSVGRELSRLLCCPFMDLDDVIVQREGRTIPEIFSTDGEAAFRQMELQNLQDIILSEAKDLAVLALGGGTVMTKECREIVMEKTVCIYMKAEVETLMEHLEGQTEGRPMLSGTCLRQRIEELMQRRAAVYEETAHHIIMTDGMSIEQVCSKIKEILKF